MLKHLCLLITTFSLCALTAAEVVTPQQPQNDFDVTFDYFAQQKAKFKNNFIGQRLKFSSGDALINWKHHFDEHKTIFLGTGYLFGEVRWQNNPYFTTTNFPYLPITIGGVSNNNLKNWYFEGSASALFDLTSGPIGTHNWYLGTAFGRYKYNDKIDLYIGFTGYMGLKQTFLLPIVGLTWGPLKDHWRLNLVFPTNMSVAYDFNPQWTAAVEWNLYIFKHRLKKNQNLRSGILRYRDTNLELYVRFAPNKYGFGKLFVGTQLYSDFSLYNSSGRNKTIYKLKPGAYFGGQLSLQF